MKCYYIGMDVHSNNTEIAVEHKGSIVSRYSVPTNIRAISAALDSVDGSKRVATEEGPMAGWLYRNLHSKVDQFVVCDPRRNKHIACDGDTDDQISSAKLAALLRGGYLRPVYHSQDQERVELKEWVILYHGRVHEAVRCINRIRGRCRTHGVRIPRAAIRNPAERSKWLSDLKNPSLAKQLNLLWISYDAVARQVHLAKCQLSSLGRKHEIITLWRQLPGIGPIRAITLFAFLDTPWRFKKKSRLWKYCGIGLVRKTSGTDKYGRPKPAYLKLAWAVNRTLKCAVMGAVISAINRNDNVFKEYYQRSVANGVIPSNARHAVARKMLSVMWGMWKNSGRFDERLVCLSVDSSRS